MTPQAHGRTNDRPPMLVISFVVTAGNYEYAIYWYFYQDGTIEQGGTIEFEAKLTGIVLTSALAPGETTDFGTLVAPQTLAAHHQHFLSIRLDMAVDGLRNTVYEVDTEAVPPGVGNPLGNAFRPVRWPLRRESEAQRVIDPLRGRYWLVANPGSGNGNSVVTSVIVLALMYAFLTFALQGAVHTNQLENAPNALSYIAQVVSGNVLAKYMILAIFYAMTGIATAVYFHKLARRSAWSFVLVALFPIASAAFLVYIIYRSVAGLGGWSGSDLVSLYVMLGIGAVIALYVRFWGHSDYFSRPRETYQPEGELVAAQSNLVNGNPESDSRDE